MNYSLDYLSQKSVLKAFSDQSYYTRAFHSLGHTLLLSLSDSGSSIPVDFCISLLEQIVSCGINNQSSNIENIFQYLPYSFFNHLLQISGVESRIPAILLTTVDFPSHAPFPMLRKKVAGMISLGEKRTNI